MKVLHTISSLGVKSGGPPLSTSLTVKGLRLKGVTANLLTYNTDLPNDKNIISDDFIYFLPPCHYKRFAYSRTFPHFLKKRVNEFDIFHCQGVWEYPSHITAKLARNYNKPYIITPRGMLYPQIIEKSKWIKKAALTFFLKKDLQQAACVHATCMEEMHHIRSLGINSPIAIIPNPIDVNISIQELVSPTKIRIGYLGRLHTRKNVELLIYAWHKLGTKTKESELVIIGGGDDSYLQFLKSEVVRLNLKNIIFTGFLKGKEKENALSSLTFLAVPSDFENFGMIIAEALLRRIPVIASKGTPWQEIETYNCGWWIDNDVNSFSEKMEEALSLPYKKVLEMGKNGQQFVVSNYSVELVAEKMVQLYNWILYKTEKPDFVYLSL